MTTTNDKTGSQTQSRDQVEEQIRIANPFLDDTSIQKLLDDRFSANTKIQKSRNYFSS